MCLEIQLVFVHLDSTAEIVHRTSAALARSHRRWRLLASASGMVEESCLALGAFERVPAQP